MGPRALVIALFALAGCPGKPVQRTPCAPALASRVELRDGAGQLTVAVKATPEAGLFDVCDAAGRRKGTVKQDAAGVTFTDEKGALGLKLHAESKSDASGEWAKGQKLRIHTENGETRVLKPDGVPLGSVVPKAGGATLFDPASRAVAQVEPRGADQAIRAVDGATLAFVVPSASPFAASAFAIDGLSVEDRATLYLFWNQ